jgi:oxygen-dependent protoporphyrinogen oxidase
VDRRPDGEFTVSGERFGMRFERQARAVVIATPAYSAAEIVQAMAPMAAEALREILHPPVTVVASAYRRREILHPLDGFGFLAPAKERPAVLGTLFSSTMFENRAPSEVAVLTTFVGGRRNPELAAAGDSEIRGAVQEELARLLGAGADPMWSEITRWPRAIPQYTMGHLQRIASVEAAERAIPGLYFCANYRGGVSIGDCVKAGHATAERLAGDLRGGAG